MRKTLAILLLGITGWVAPGAARADFVYANTTTSTAGVIRLLGFDSGTPGTILSNVQITGVAGNLVGIDFRPATGQLIGVGNNGGVGTVYRIDQNTGTAVSLLSGFALSGTSFGVDFNPVADALRVTSDTGQNLRITAGGTGTAINDAVLNNADSTRNPLNVVAAAYTNNFAGAATTTLFALQDNTGRPDTLYIINPPNGGTLTTPVDLAINVSQLSGFDITADNRAFLSWNGGNQFGTLNLTTGQAVNNGAIGGGFAGQIAGIAVSAVPEPASIAMVGMGGLLLAGWLRKRSS